MREISIIKSFDHEDGKRWPNWLKHTGFINEKRISPVDLAVMAGWPIDVNICVTDSVSDDTFFDATYEEDKKEAELLGNPNYGFKDADFDSLGPQRINPREGESWVFVLGDRLYIN